jgi:hypothetical protein
VSVSDNFTNLVCRVAPHRRDHHSQIIKLTSLRDPTSSSPAISFVCQRKKHTSSKNTTTNAIQIHVYGLVDMISSVAISLVSGLGEAAGNFVINPVSSLVGFAATLVGDGSPSQSMAREDYASSGD